MKLHVRTKGFELAPAAEQALLHRIDRLDRLLHRVDPDLVHLSVDLERRDQRGGEYTGNVRLVVMNRVLPAQRNSGGSARALIKRAFDDIEAELERFTAKLRREPARRRAPRALHAVG